MSLGEQLTVCICTCNRPDDLRLAIESAERHAPAARIVVSDDGKSPAADVVDGHPRCRWQKGPGRGLGANRNAAIAAADTSWILFLDDDAMLGPDFLPAVESCQAQMDPGDAPRTIVTGRERQGDELVSPNDVDFLGFQRRPYAAGEPLRTVVINAAVWPSELFHRVRFDERLLYGSDEVDVSYAAIAAGYRICSCPEAINDHRPSPIGRDAYPIQAHVSRLRATTKRHWNGRHRLINTAAFLALAPLHLLIGLLKRQGLRGFATYVRAMRAWLLGNRPKTTN